MRHIVTAHGSHRNLRSFGLLQETENRMQDSLITYSASFVDMADPPRSIDQLRSNQNLLIDLYNLLRTATIEHTTLKFCLIIRARFVKDSAETENPDMSEEMVTTLRSDWHELNPSRLHLLDAHILTSFRSLETRLRQLEFCGSNWAIDQILEFSVQIIETRNELCNVEK